MGKCRHDPSSFPDSHGQKRLKEDNGNIHGINGVWNGSRRRPSTSKYTARSLLVAQYLVKIAIEAR
jgi:hypothetical protein